MLRLGIRATVFAAVLLGAVGHKTPSVPAAELLDSTSLTASPSGVIHIEVACPAGRGHCAGVITLRTLNAVGAAAPGHRAKAHTLSLAVGSFSVAGGRIATVKLHLSVQARKLLARWPVLHARATITARDPSGTTQLARPQA